MWYAKYNLLQLIPSQIKKLNVPINTKKLGKWPTATGKFFTNFKAQRFPTLFNFSLSTEGENRKLSKFFLQMSA